MPRFAVPATAVALLLSLACAATASAAVPRDFVGLVTEDSYAEPGAYRNAQLARQAALGVGTIRQPFDWAEFEQHPGEFDTARYDSFVLDAARHGIRILPVLFNPPPHQSGAPPSGARRGTYPPRSNRAMGEFGARLFRRYGRGGSVWSENPGVPYVPIVSAQVWNEPSLRVYWGGRPNARQYVRMLKIVGRAIKRVDRRAEIVTAGIPDSRSRAAVPIRKFIAQMYRAGARSAFDTLAVNAYARNHREMLRTLRSIRRLMNSHRDRRAPMWLTEFGWASGGPRGRYTVGEAGQAREVGRTFRSLFKVRRKLRIRGAVYYSWRDGRPYAPDFRDFWGLHTGLLRLDMTEKPAFAAFEAAIAPARRARSRRR